MSFQGTTRTDPHERSLAHAALISDEWRRSDRGARDGAHKVEPVCRASFQAKRRSQAYRRV